MARKRQKTAEVFYCFKTKARCTDKRTGKRLVAYLFGELSPVKAKAFEKHMSGCLVCGAAVLNAWNIEAALKRDGTARSGRAAT